MKTIIKIIGIAFALFVLEVAVCSGQSMYECWGCGVSLPVSLKPTSIISNRIIYFSQYGDNIWPTLEEVNDAF